MITLWPVTIIVSAESGPLRIPTRIDSMDEFEEAFSNSGSWPDVWAFFKNAQNPDLRVLRAKDNACDFAKAVAFVNSTNGLIIAPEAFRRFQRTADLVRLTKAMTRFAEKSTQHIAIVEYPNQRGEAYMQSITAQRIGPADTHSPHCQMTAPALLKLENGHVIGPSAPFAALNQNAITSDRSIWEEGRESARKIAQIYQEHYGKLVPLKQGD
jgi:hypothetical protein